METVSTDIPWTSSNSVLIQPKDYIGFYMNADIFRNQRAKPIIVDPGLYLSKKSDIAWTTQRRSLPTSFKLFTGVFLIPFPRFSRGVNAYLVHIWMYIIEEKNLR